MTKRYFGDLDNYAESDIVIIGAGEALCTTRLVCFNMPVKLTLCVSLISC
jgi:ribulose 1,5-bisphosphate synthetase/thiazole synthase